MNKVRVKIVDQENLSWPPSCVLCLKSSPEKRYELSFGERKLHIPYCQGCYDKVKRRERLLVERSATLSAAIGVLGGTLGSIIYLLYSFRQGGGETLLDLGRWKMAVVVFWIVLGVIILLTTFFQVLTEPLLDFILLSIFPNKFAKPGVKIGKTSVRETLTHPHPGMEIKTETPIIEELEFVNPGYATKFREINGL